MYIAETKNLFLFLISIGIMLLFLTVIVEIKTKYFSDMINATFRSVLVFALSLIIAAVLVYPFPYYKNYRGFLCVLLGVLGLRIYLNFVSKSIALSDRYFDRFLVWLFQLTAIICSLSGVFLVSFGLYFLMLLFGLNDGLATLIYGLSVLLIFIIVLLIALLIKLHAS
jgi:hypothetical protein